MIAVWITEWEDPEEAVHMSPPPPLSNIIIILEK